MKEVVCGTCGSGSRPHLIRNCARCDAHEHCYCMQKVSFFIPQVWYCNECQTNAHGALKPNRGGQTDLQRPLHDRGPRKLQTSPKTSNRFESSKVKFLSCEEATLLSRERPAYGRSNFATRQSQVGPASPPSMKHPTNMKCTSPCRSSMQSHALKQCAAVSHNQGKAAFTMRQSQSRPASAPNVKQSSTIMKCISPSRSEKQVHALKRCAPASHDQAKVNDWSGFATRKNHVQPTALNVKQSSDMKCTSSGRSAAAASDDHIEDTKMRWEARSGSLIHRYIPVEGKPDSHIEDRIRKRKIVNAEKRKGNCKLRDEPREKGALCASGHFIVPTADATGSESETKSQNHNIGTLLVIESSEEYSRRPSSTSCWMGCFLVSDAGKKHNFADFKAYFPSKVSPKVYDIANMMPCNLVLELLPRMNDWPKSFETDCPVHEDIGLFFFSNKLNWHEKKHQNLLEASSNYVMRAYINDIKLLIYSSEMLPPDSQCIDGESYLWGVFVRSKRKSNCRRLGSTSM